MHKEYLNSNNQIELSKNSKANSKQIELKVQQYLKIQKNILELIINANSLYSKKNIERKNHSVPNTKNRREKLKTKFQTKENKRIYQKNELLLKGINDYSSNLNIENDKKRNLKKKETQQLNEKENSNKEQLNNDMILNINNRNSNLNFNIKTSKYNIDNINQYTNLLNNKDKSSNNDILEHNHKLSSTFINNSNNNINLLNYYNNNSITNKSKQNYILYYYGINNNNLENSSSLNSSQKELSSKKYKNKLISHNNRINNLSSSYFGKNFVLKSEICKNSFVNENKYYKNINSEDNPIINYYNNGNNGKGLRNFYLLTDKKQIEEIDQSLNYVSFDEKESKTKFQKIIGCSFIDRKIEIPEKITSFIINKNNENFSRDNFNLKEFQGSIINAKNLNFENIKNNMYYNNLNNINIITKREHDDNMRDIKKDEIMSNDNNYNINKNISNEKDINNKVDFRLNDNKGKIIIKDNKYANQNNNENNFNNTHNSINNQRMPNIFCNQNMIINSMINNFNSNFLPLNFYQKINLYQNDYLKSLNNQKIQNRDDISWSNINDKNNNNINSPNNSIINDNLKNEIKNNDINNNDINNINNNSNNNYIINNNSFLKNKNFYEYSEEEILNLSILLIKDKLGSLFMEKKIKLNFHFANELLFPKIKYNLKELCCHSDGNYFIQIILDVLSFDNINKFFDLTQSEFTEICISHYGTRVIQKIIDKILSKPILINKFIFNLNSKDLGIILKSPYGNHIIQKFLETFHSSEYSNFIYNFIHNKFLDITNSKHGVCVVQKCIKEGDEKQREELYKLILKNFISLIKDKFGNYLVQYILINTKTSYQFKEILPIIKKIEENMVDLCISKYSSNVIEKCFENSENMIREHLLYSLLSRNSESIIDIILDPKGIYVIQKAFKINNLIYKNKLIEIINRKEKELKDVNFDNYKYRNILKTINSNKELQEVFSKIIKKEHNNDLISYNKENNNNNLSKEEVNNNKNDYYNYNNIRKNKK